MESRRWAIALFLALATLSVGSAIAGYGEGAPENAPETFTTAAGRPGDKAVYATSMVVVTGGTGATFTDANATFAFTRLPDRWSATQGQQVVQEYVADWDTQPFTWDIFMPGWGGWSGGWDDWDGDWSGWGSDSETQVEGTPWQATAHTRLGETVETTYRLGDPRVAGRTPPSDQGIPEDTGTLTVADSLGGPCGFRHSLQGNAHDLREPIVVHGQCPPPLEVADVAIEAAAGPSRLVVSGEDHVDGARALVFADENNPDRLRLWFTEAVPYPVRMLTTLPEPFGVAMPSNMGIGFYTLYELVGFTPGSATELPPEPPQLDLQPVGSGLTAHPEDPAHLALDLTEALRILEQDEEVAAWLQRHPNAEPVAASASERSEDGETVEAWRWHVQLADEDAGLATTAEWRRAPPEHDTHRLALPMQVDSYPVTSAPAAGATAAQTLAPTGASILARANTWLAEPAQHWGYDRTADQYWAGFEWLYLDRGTAPHAASDEVASGARARVTMTSDGTVVSILQQPSSYPDPEYAADPYGDGDAPQEQGSSTPWGFQAASVSAWSWPAPKTVATIGAGAAGVGLLALLWPTLKTLTIGLFTRFRPEQLLEHPVRAELVELVSSDPGIHFQELVRRIGKGRGTVEHHLRKLVAAERLLERSEGGFSCYFPKGTVDRRVMAAAPALKSDAARRILAAILARPGATTKDLAPEVGMAASTVNHHVKRLTAAGMLEPRRDGRFVRLHGATQAADALATYGTPAA